MALYKLSLLLLLLLLVRGFGQQKFSLGDLVKEVSPSGCQSLRINVILRDCPRLFCPTKIGRIVSEENLIWGSCVQKTMSRAISLLI